MTKVVPKDSPISSTRYLAANFVVLTIFGLLAVRLWYIQIYKGEYYQKVAERNRIRRIEIPAPRGIIYDRFGKVVLGNRPFYDLVLVPQFSRERETTFKILSRLLHVPTSHFERRMQIGAGRPKYLPIVLKRNLSLHEVSTIESNRIFLPGIEVRVAPRRDYSPNLPVHMAGYLGEIDPQTMKALNEQNPGNRYLPGDLIGKQGLEARWEKYLRGKNGFQLIQVDAFGRKAAEGSTDWDLPLAAAQPGSDLELTIDRELQLAAKQAFKGKYGAVVVLDAQNGEVLAMVSEPGYDPTIYQRSLSRDEWYALIKNPFKPLFDKTTGGEYIPGSIYKAVVAFAALEENVVNLKTTHNCPGHFTLGDQTFQCWEKGGHGSVNLRQALMKSCDVFFYQVGVELGVDIIAKYARSLGLGTKLGVNLNLERPGLVPTAAWKRKTRKAKWTAGDTPNIAIGQGYNLLTPVQMASLYATIANGGKVWRPFVVKRVVNHLGENVLEQQPRLNAQVELISSESFRTVRRLLRAVVMDPEGTGKNARVEGQTVAGKTGSAQVVSLKKNTNNKNDDVSVKWKEHAIFTAFSPVEHAEIALAIVSENDAYGGGGAQAAPIAGKIIDAYWRLKKQRQTAKMAKKPAGQREEIGGRKN